MKRVSIISYTDSRTPTTKQYAKKACALTGLTYGVYGRSVMQANKSLLTV